MSLAAVRDKIDNWLTPRWSWLVDKQDFYYRPQVWDYGTPEVPVDPPILIQDGMNTGYYFQGLWTHGSVVTQTDALDGDTIADQLHHRPSDQVHDWRHVIQTAFDSLPMPARLKIDCYNGPAGLGWVAVLQVLYQGVVYQRSKQVGPETWRTEAWHAVIPGEEL